MILLKILVVVLVVLGVVKIVDILRKKEKVDTQKKEAIEESTFVACKACGTYVDRDEAIISSGGYYCSKECMESSK